MNNLKDNFNLAAIVLGGAGTLLFGIGTVTEIAQGTDTVATVAAAFAASSALLAVGIFGTRKPKDPKP